MSSEEKINELEQRIIVLENIEKRRKTMFWIKFSLKAIVVIVILVFVYKAYATIISYKEKLDNLQNVQDKLDNTGDYLQEQIDKLKDFNIFN